ncbi:two-component system sensor histidine kinase VanS [Alkalihalobacillus xiaoxiensis]|uniref:histidine kinase n=2 Tax=Shouchella xiaoxiensis TaxID=766895 RepID=A0ABS2STD2_9BACI|nr:two-component system sensor histidine kinase VanS [Shouchella xiaoxiensis]
MNKQFSQLKRKMIGQVIAISIVTAVLGLIIYYIFIDGILQAPFAELFVMGLQTFWDIEYYEAVGVYATIFRQNKTLWLAFGFIVLLLIVFYFALSRFKSYFIAISKGIDALAAESTERIALPDELDFMERKLQSVKDTLKERAVLAQEAEQRKNDLVVYLAHDIKTPLTSVIGYLSLLNEAKDMPIEQRAKYVDITLDKAHRLEQLIDEFFEITRFNLQTIVLEKEQLNLPFMLMQLADEFYPLFEAGQLQAEVDAVEELTIPADPDKLGRVFNNILKNAVAYSSPNSVIYLRARTEKDNAIITIENTGKPIPPSKLERIFEKFYRLDASRGTQTGGAGLGLAISKEIVVAHGGTISATSSDNKTVFSVRLPLN